MIQADDLTGAADTAVGFAAAGLSSRRAAVARRGARSRCRRRRWSPSTRPAVTSRRRERARSGGGVVAHCDDRAWLYKKVDSTLRGNVAAELAAVERALRPSRVVVAPAFPALGRTTVDGVQRWDGGEVDVAALLGRDVRRRRADGGPRRARARARGSAPRDRCSSAPAGWPRPSPACAARRPHRAPVEDGPVLVVSGSRTALAARQVDRLEVAVRRSRPARRTGRGHARRGGVSSRAPRHRRSATPRRGWSSSSAATPRTRCARRSASPSSGRSARPRRARRSSAARSPDGRDLRLVLKSGSFGDDDALARIVTGA